MHQANIGRQEVEHCSSVAEFVDGVTASLSKKQVDAMLLGVRSGWAEPTFLVPLRDEVLPEGPLSRLFEQGPVKKRPDGRGKGAVFASPDIPQEIAFVTQLPFCGRVGQCGCSKNQLACSTNDRSDICRVEYTDAVCADANASAYDREDAAAEQAKHRIGPLALIERLLQVFSQQARAALFTVSFDSSARDIENA